MDRNEGSVYMLTFLLTALIPQNSWEISLPRGKEAMRSGRWSIGWELQVLVLGLEETHNV